MALTFAQSATPASTGTSPTSVTFSSATTAGQLVVVAITNDSGSVLSTGVTDNLGNTYTRAVSGGGQMLEIWYSLITTGSTPHTVSVAWSTAATGRTTVAAQVFSGFTGTSPLDVIATSSGTSTNASSGTTGTLSTTSSLVVTAATGAAATGAALSLGPVATYGLASAGTTTDSGDSNYRNATKITTTATGGYVSSIGVYVGATVGTAPNNQWQAAIYADSSGAPGTLISATAQGTLVANSLNTLPIDVQLAPSTSYWLAYNTNGTASNQNNLKYNTGGTSVSSSTTTAFGTWPSPFGSANSAAVTFSIFVNYTEYGNLSTLGASGSSIGMCSKTTTSQATQTGTMTLATSQFWRCAAAVFKEVSAAGGTNLAVLTGGFLVL